MDGNRIMAKQAKTDHPQSGAGQKAQLFQALAHLRVVAAEGVMGVNRLDLCVSASGLSSVKAMVCDMRHLGKKYK